MANAITTYSNTQAELIIAKERLSLLMDRKEKIYTKFFPLVAKVTDTPAHTNKKSDPMADYVHEITKPNSITGVSLEDEIEEARNEVNRLEYCLRSMIRKRTSYRLETILSKNKRRNFEKFSESSVNSVL